MDWFWDAFLSFRLQSSSQSSFLSLLWDNIFHSWHQQHSFYFRARKPIRILLTLLRHLPSIYYVIFCCFPNFSTILREKFLDENSCSCLNIRLLVLPILLFLLYLQICTYDDDDDDDDELFFGYGWPTKGVYTLFPAWTIVEILTIANLRHAASRVWTCAESEFRLCLMKLCSSDNHYWYR